MWTQRRVLKTELVIEKYFSISIKALHIRGLTLAADAEWSTEHPALSRSLLVTSKLSLTTAGVIDHGAAGDDDDMLRSAVHEFKSNWEPQPVDHGLEFLLWTLC